ncbi:hypothetical protein GGR53DRAFT_87065 [Hypoxylon sp. FL1150]|nr:hypothetical protein GGR53DRAFT_87065 [Hypoxylon sp. FL1150]
MQVEDETRPLALPHAVVIVPEKLKFRGVPLVRGKAALSRYLSHKYSLECIFYIKCVMYVKELSGDEFIEDMKEYVNDESNSPETVGGNENHVPFKAQSTEWHSHAASILWRYLPWQSTVRQMRIIPLSDGKTWIAATPESKGTIFFMSQENLEHDTLDGINIRFVHPDITVEKEEHRYRLFEALGVEKFEASKLCKLVEAAHKNASGTFASTVGGQSLEMVLISHALFLFRNNHSPSVDLWVATEAGKESRAAATYFQDIERAVDGWQCPVLHRDYYTSAKDEEKDRWMKWLDMELGIRKYPRLVDSFPRLNGSTSSQVNISEEMERILNDTVNWKPYDILKLLQRHWNTGHWANYSQWLRRDATDVRWPSASIAELRERISELQVTCLGPRGQVTHSLKGAILPSADLEGAFEGAPLFILDVQGGGVNDIERVEGRTWYFLHHLGVKMNTDLDDCIACLRALRDEVDTKKGDLLKYVRSLYDRIMHICHEASEHNGRVKDIFDSEGLIYIPRYSSTYRNGWPISGTWVTARKCVWKGVKYATLKDSNVLSHHYARHENLFRDIVRIQSTVQITDILSEIEFNADAYGPADFYDILRELSEFIKETPDAGSYKSRRSGSDFRSVLSRHRIFPVSQPGSTSIMNDTCATTSQWFIPDHEAFHSLFVGKIPLMAISPAKIVDISHILQYLGCNQRRLSLQARAYPTDMGKVRYANTYSAMLKGKAKYIQSLVPQSAPYRRPSLMAVEIAVHEVDSDTLTVEWEVEYDGSTCKSSVYESQIVVMLYGKVLTIYMPARYLQQNALPPWDLSYDLASLLGIPAEHSAFVEQILTRVWDFDTTEIEKALAKRGFQFDLFREDDIQDEKLMDGPLVPETEEKGNEAFMKGEPRSIKKEASQLVEKVAPSMEDMQTTSASHMKDEKDKKDENHKKSQTKVFSAKFGLSANSSSTQMPTRTIVDGISPSDPKDENEDGEDLQEDYSPIDMQIPLFSDEQLKDFRPILLSPTPNDNGDPDDSDYSTDDSDPPLPGAQLGPRRHGTKMPDNIQNAGKGKLSAPGTERRDQTKTPTMLKPSPATSKPGFREVSFRELRQFISPLQNTTRNKRVDEQYRATRRLQNTGLFKMSGPASIIYVSNPDDLPPMESKQNDTQVLATLQARMQIFKGDNRSVFALIPTIANDGDTELAFLGQAWVR